MKLLYIRNVKFVEISDEKTKLIQYKNLKNNEFLPENIDNYVLAHFAKWAKKY